MQCTQHSKEDLLTLPCLEVLLVPQLELSPSCLAHLTPWFLELSLFC